MNQRFSLFFKFFCINLFQLHQLISASASLSHFCTYHNLVTFSLSALSRIPSHNSTASFFCLKLLFVLFLHPVFILFSSSVCYQLYSRLSIHVVLFSSLKCRYMNNDYFFCFMFCYFYLVSYFFFIYVKRFRGIFFLDRALCKFWYNKNNNDIQLWP
jgi:hypothetical protein